MLKVLGKFLITTTFLMLAMRAAFGGIELRLEATAEVTEIVNLPREALPTMDKAITDFAKSRHFKWSLRYGPNRYQLLAELDRHDVRLIVTNPFPNSSEVHFFVYRVPNSQIGPTEMEALVRDLKRRVLIQFK